MQNFTCYESLESLLRWIIYVFSFSFVFRVYLCNLSYECKVESLRANYINNLETGALPSLLRLGATEEQAYNSAKQVKHLDLVIFYNLLRELKALLDL